MSDVYALTTRASLFLGGSPIQSFTENTREVEIFSNLWQPVLTETLGLGHWNFASVYFSLNKLNTTPPDPKYLYSYQLPADYQAVRTTFDQGGLVLTGWSISGTTLYANVEPVTLYYVRNWTDTDLAGTPGAPGWFENLYVANLALHAAIPFTGKESWVAAAQKYFSSALDIAQTRNAREGGLSKGSVAPGAWRLAHAGRITQ